MDNWKAFTNNLHNVCRICLEESKTMSSIFENNNIHRMSVAELLQTCMSLRIEENKGLPGLVCTRCESEVLQICDFRTKLENSEKHLQQYIINLQNKYIENPEIIFVKGEKIVDNDSIDVYPEEIVNTGFKEINNILEFIEENEVKDNIPKEEYSPIKSGNEAQSTIFECTKCKKIFPSKLELSDHRRKLLHYARKTVTCPQCKLLIPVQNYKSHFLKHTKKDFKCEQCDKTFSNNFNLKRHLNIHTNLTPYTCEICEAKFSRQDKLKTHVMIHTSQKPFTCDICNQQFKRKEKLKYHQERSCLYNNPDSNCQDSKYKRILSCDICSKSFTLASSLKTHKLLHTDERVICSDCGKPYPNEQKLNAHILLVHSKKNSKGKEFLCNFCAKQYSSKPILERHILKHMGLSKIYNCKVCNKSFTQSGSLAFHLKIHTGEKPFVCHICSRAFNKPSNLQRHLRSHNNIRPYVCAICEKCFSVKQSLILHTRIHTGEKPFACPVCDKKFIDRGSMKKHIKIHNAHDGNVS